MRTWLRTVQAWLNATSGKHTSTQQAAAIQLGVEGIASAYALSLPPNSIQHGAIINGVQSDPVTYVLYSLATRFEALEDERSLRSGTLLLDFDSKPGERIDELLVRFDLARHEARQVNADITNYHQLATILLRAARFERADLIPILKPLEGRMPTTQAQLDTLYETMRQYGHITNRVPGNINQSLAGRRNQRTYHTEAEEDYMVLDR